MAEQKHTSLKLQKITWSRAAAWRARQNHLDRRAPADSLVPVAGRLCGLHAQVLSSAELTAWARVEGLERGAVQKALWADRTLVKTWAMRGTLHLLPAEELSLWHAALSVSPRYLRPAAWQNYYGITMKELESLTEAIGAALRDQVMTREELVHAVVRLTGHAELGKKLAASSWGTMLKPAAFTGRLCFAPSIGQRVRFTHPYSWLAGASSSRVADPQTAAEEITRRFLAAYGPATYADLARWWGGGGLTAAKQWIARLGEEVVPVDLEGARAWMLAAHARELREVAPLRSVRLLPAFDQYVVAASCHAAELLPGDFRSRVYRPQGWLSPVLLVNGRMQGVWQHGVKGSRVEVVIRPFAPAPAWVRRAAAQEAERLATFCGGSLSLVWKK
jgi:hypothetical protein